MMGLAQATAMYQCRRWQEPLKGLTGSQRSITLRPTIDLAQLPGPDAALADSNYSLLVDRKVAVLMPHVITGGHVASQESGAHMHALVCVFKTKQGRSAEPRSNAFCLPCEVCSAG